MLHASHPEIRKRLKRAEGHLRRIIDMIDSGRDCLVIAQQMQAVQKAVESAKTALVHDHIDHCIERAVGPLSRDKRRPLDEFKAITRYL
jgi:hypothetical protein NreA